MNFHWVNTVIILFFSALIPVHAQKGPQPGDIYRQYSVSLRANDNWRVTDPEALNPGAAEFLPNPVLSIFINDLDKAVRAEVTMDVWGGHAGTSGKQFRFNNNEWIDIPRVPTLLSRPNCYVTQYNVTIDIPLEFLHEGLNSFEGTADRQVCNNFEWGQWGWYVMIVRIYYSREKLHSEAQIVQPLSGDTIYDEPLIKISARDTAAVSEMQVLSKYYGYDENGDGIYYDWHGAYHTPALTGHVGNIKYLPYELSWDTYYVPDQEPAAVSFVARILDTTGIWFVTEVVDSVTLIRPDSLSVGMFTPVGIPQNFVIGQNQYETCYINIDSLEHAIEAKLFHRTWNGIGGRDEKPLEINGSSYKTYGKDHYFALSDPKLSVADLNAGRNNITYTTERPAHGIEVLWPGPSIIIRYLNGADSVAAPEFLPEDGYGFHGSLSPEIYSSTEDAQIFYTTDGSDPNPSDELYEPGKITLDHSTTLKARAFKSGYYESDVSIADYLQDVTSVGLSSEKHIYHYPNPVDNQLFLDIPSGLEGGSFKIISMEGKVVLSGELNNNIIKTRMLEEGIYFIVYSKKKTEYSARFIVRH